MYAAGIHNDEIAKRVVNIIAEFVQIEEYMTNVLAVLLGAKETAPSRLVVRTIKNPKAKIDLMKTLLEEAPHNIRLDSFYDEVIDEFAALNRIRNSYVHGIWWTHSSKDVYLSEFLNEIEALQPRHIQVAELDAILKRQYTLIEKLFHRPYVDMYGPPEPLPDNRVPNGDKSE